MPNGRFRAIAVIGQLWKAVPNPSGGAPMFRLLRLNPPNGWNAVAWELAIVVVGVVIALGAQQAADALRWRDEVRRTEDALTIEIAESIVHASERQMIGRCLGDRLTHLIGKVSSNNGAWKADPMPLQRTTFAVQSVPAAYRTPNRKWNDNVWESAQSGGVFNHMPRERVAAFSKIYAIMEGLRKDNESEHQLFPQLLYLSFDTELDAAARQQALAALGRLDWLNATTLLDGKRLIEEVGTMRLDFSRTGLKRELAEAERTQRVFRGNCVHHFGVPL